MTEEFLIYISMLLLLGTLVSALANKLKVSNIFFLVFAGMLLGSFGLLTFPHNAILVISTLAMSIVIFDSTIRLKFREIEQFSSRVMRLIIIHFILIIIIMSGGVFLFINPHTDPYLSLVLSVSFAALIYGLDHDLSLEPHKKKKNKAITFLQVESLLNRPLTIILPLLLLNYIQAIATGESILFQSDILIFLQQVIISLGIGAIIGIIIHFILNTKIQEQLAYLIVLTSSIITFILTEAVHGSGVLSLTVFSLIFGNFHVRHRMELEKYTSIFSYVFNIFVFMLIGTFMLIDFEKIMLGSILFIIYLFIRFISVQLALYKSEFSQRNRLFMTLNVTKGIDVAIVILIMITSFSSIEGVETIINLSLLFALYSFVISNLASLFIEPLLEHEHKKKGKRRRKGSD